MHPDIGHWLPHFSVAQGRFLETGELRTIMGFPHGLRDDDCSDAAATRLLGNTMHVGIVGLAIGILAASP